MTGFFVTTMFGLLTLFVLTVWVWRDNRRRMQKQKELQLFVKAMLANFAVQDIVSRRAILASPDLNTIPDNVMNRNIEISIQLSELQGARDQALKDYIRALED